MRPIASVRVIGNRTTISRAMASTKSWAFSETLNLSSTVWPSSPVAEGPVIPAATLDSLNILVQERHSAGRVEGQLMPARDRRLARQGMAWVHEHRPLDDVICMHWPTRSIRQDECLPRIVSRGKCGLARPNPDRGTDWHVVHESAVHTTDGE